MKTLLLSAVLSLLFLSSSFDGFSQTEKGSKLLGGSGSLQFYDPFFVSLYPNAGIFVVDKLALGSAVSISFSSGSNSRYTSLGISPFARYYFGKSRIQYFVLANAGLYRSWYTSVNPPFEDVRNANNVFDARAGLGAVYFITQQVGLEATLNYNIYGNASQRDNNLVLNFGFQIYLPSAKE
jgi:outer membrane protein